MVEENTGTLDENGEAEITFIPEVEGTPIGMRRKSEYLMLLIEEYKKQHK